MIAFELNQPTEVFLSNFQTKPEHHGDVLVDRMDMTVVWTTSVRSLAMLHPLLAARLCSNVPPEMLLKGDQAMMDLATEELAFVMFARLKMPLGWDLELTRYTMVVDWGLDEAYMAVSQCKLHKFEFELINGGSCTIRWTISSSADINEELAGHMTLQQQRKVYIKLLAPSQQEIDASSSSDAPKSKAKSKKPKGEKNTESNGAAPNGAQAGEAGGDEAGGETTTEGAGEGDDASHPDPATAAFIDSQKSAGGAQEQS